MILFELKELCIVFYDEVDNKKLLLNYEIWFDFVNNILLYGICYVFWRCFLWVWVGWLFIFLMFLLYFCFIVYKLL